MGLFKKETEIVWQDRKRHLGLPLSFTVYTLDRELLHCQSGLLSRRVDFIPLYRVHDVHFRASLWQRLFKVGTVIVFSEDATSPRMELGGIRSPAYIQGLIYRLSEEAKLRRHQVFVSAGGDEADGTGDEDILDTDTW